MSEMKCPFCNSEIEQLNDQQRSLFHCSNIVCCKGGHYIGNISMWRDLIRTRKALDVAKNGLEYIFGYEGVPKYVVKHVRQVLDQIKNETALEQKD